MSLSESPERWRGRHWAVALLAVALLAYGGWFGLLHLDIDDGRERLSRRILAGHALNDADQRLTFDQAGSAGERGRKADELLAEAQRLLGEGSSADVDPATDGHLRAAREHIAGGRLAEANVEVHAAAVALRSGSGALSARLGEQIDQTRSAALGGAFFGFLSVGALMGALRGLAAASAWRRRWELSLQAASDGWWEWDIRSGAVEFSERWCEQVGVRGQTLDTWFSRVHPDDVLELRAALDRHLTGGAASFENEHRVLDRNGRWRWMLARGQAERASGAASRMVCWQTDITDRRIHADAAERAALIGHVADATGMAVFAVDDAGVIWQRNSAAEVLGRAWGGAAAFWERLSDAAESPTMAECPECGRPQRAGARIVELLTPAGARRVCQLTWTGHGHRLVRERVVNVVLVADVTLRALAEESARVAHERVVASDAELRAAFDAVPAVVFVVRDGGVLFANRGARTTFGEGAGAFEVLGAAVAATGGAGASTTTLVRRLGEADASFEVYRPVPIAFQGAPAELWVAKDVTRRVKAEAQLRAAERMIALGGLAAGLAHEINNPLTYVIGNLELAQDGVGDVAERVSRALGGAVRIRQVVAQLRALSNQGGGELGAVRLSEVLDDTVNVAMGLGLGSARVQRDVDPDLEVHGNAVWIGQILLNLMANALHAMASRAPEARTLSMVARRDGGDIVLELGDSGTGVPAALQERIFEPFVSTRAQGEGSGLGLYICRELARRMDASLSLERTGPEGSTFALRLPVARPAPPRTRTLTPLPPPAPLRVLVVDDDPGLHTLLRECLAPAQLSGAHDLAGARALLPLGGWDVVVLDIALPDGTGIELFEALQRAGDALAERVVFVSGGSVTPDIARFVLECPCPVVFKPFDLRSFRALVERRARAAAEEA